MKKILISSVLISTGLIISCGGGGGGDSKSQATGQITSSQQAVTASVNSVAFVESSGGLIQDTENIGEASVSPKRGWLRTALNFYKNNLNTPSQQSTSCDNGGSYDITESGTTISIRFENCGFYCETDKYVIFNGEMVISGTDTNDNGIIENGSIVAKRGLTYNNQCDGEDVYFEKDLTISLSGELPNGDVEDGEGNYKATLIINGGPVKVTENSKYEKGSFDNLKFHLNEVDPDNADYEWSINGKFSYVDNYCITSPVNLSLNTTKSFKGYDLVDCEYTGEISINDGLIVGISYDPDNDPLTENKFKLIFEGQVVFDDICTKFETPDSCQ